MPLYSAGLCDAVKIAPGSARAAGGEVQQVGRHEAEVDHVEALRLHATGELGNESRPGRAHVATDQHLGGIDIGGEGDAQRVRDLRRELVRNRSPDVVGLDNLVENGHDGATCYRRRRSDDGNVLRIG